MLYFKIIQLKRVFLKDQEEMVVMLNKESTEGHVESIQLTETCVNKEIEITPAKADVSTVRDNLNMQKAVDNKDKCFDSPDSSKLAQTDEHEYLVSREITEHLTKKDNSVGLFPAHTTEHQTDGSEEYKKEKDTSYFYHMPPSNQIHGVLTFRDGDDSVYDHCVVLNYPIKSKNHKSSLTVQPNSSISKQSIYRTNLHIATD